MGRRNETVGRRRRDPARERSRPWRRRRHERPIRSRAAAAAPASAPAEPRRVDDPLAKYFARSRQMKLDRRRERHPRDAAPRARHRRDPPARRRLRERRGRAVRDREVAALQRVHRLRRVPERRVRPRGRARPLGRLRRGARRDRGRPASAARRAPYWGPAHRRAVDIALETRDSRAACSRGSRRSRPPTRSRPRPRASAHTCAAAPRTTPGKLPDAEGELVHDLEEEPAVLVGACTCAA